MAHHERELERVAHRHQSLQVVVASLREAVGEARAAGAPWSAIAEVMELSEDELIAAFNRDVSTYADG